MQGGTQNFDRRYEVAGSDMLFDLEQDPGQEHPLWDPEHPLWDPELEVEMCRKLVRTMISHDSPPEQFARLGLEMYL